MAVTAVIQDGDDVSAAEINQFAGCPGKTGVLLGFGRIYYNGSIWQVDSTHDSFGLSAPAFASNQLTITLSNLNAAPIVVANQNHNATNVYHVRVHTPSATQIQVKFYNTSGTLITTQDTSMDIYLMVMGA